jgi:sterol desaturase/sphingolipid hydroxylase (fatty acid hydroxylase superfamily)
MVLEQFFGDTQNQSTQVILFGIVFLVCWNLERLYGVSKGDYDRQKHAFTNLLFILPGLVMQSLLGIVFLKVLLHENANNIGLLPYFNINSNLWQMVITFIVLDFFYWIYHFLMHKIKFAWRFHAVHHSDKIMNVTTSLREHPGETFIRLSHYMLAIWLLGPYFWIVTLHQFIQITSKIIVHSNWRIPDKADKYISYLLLTPNMHHVHHHQDQPYTDSNFGDLFSIWDRIFGTFKYLHKDEVVFGLDVEVFEDESNKQMKFKGLIKAPFSKDNLSND